MEVQAKLARSNGSPNKSTSKAMSNHSPEKLIDRHEAFLECRPAARPLVGLWAGGYFPAEQFPQATSSWPTARTLQSADITFLPFAADYEHLHRLHQNCNDDFFYVGSPYWGVPWLEAILGCSVTVAAANCRAEPCLKMLSDTDRLAIDLDDNPWVYTLERFTRELVTFADGRFPVCPPLLRGAGDAASAMLGGEAFVTGMIDEPEAVKRLLDHCSQTRLALLNRLHKMIPSWQGTHAAGGYPSKLWCQRTVAYYQEDSAALLSPRLFREFLLPPARQACEAAEVNFIHLHSACLYPVDILLEDGTFDVIEINLDHGGVSPKVAKLIPIFQRIQQAGRPLVLWGDCLPEEWELIRHELRPVGLSLQPFAPSSEKVAVKPKD
jgi:hypothetical protein